MRSLKEGIQGIGEINLSSMSGGRYNDSNEGKTPKRNFY
jgi:hypothetical protein